MHSPFITNNGGRRVDCCDRNCQQGRACPVRQACELPDDSPRSLLASKWLYIAGCASLAVWGVIALALWWPK